MRRISLITALIFVAYLGHSQALLIIDQDFGRAFTKEAIGAESTEKLLPMCQMKFDESADQ